MYLTESMENVYLRSQYLQWDKCIFASLKKMDYNDSHYVHTSFPLPHRFTLHLLSVCGKEYKCLGHCGTSLTMLKVKDEETKLLYSLQHVMKLS